MRRLALPVLAILLLLAACAPEAPPATPPAAPGAPPPTPPSAEPPPPPPADCTVGPARADCICTMEYAPVCGCDGKTYGNPCVASCSGVPDHTPGECPARNDSA